MTSETYQESSYDRKGQKRPNRPKLLKLTDVSMPHRNRKKTKTKVKERSQSNVRDRIYDDPAYTDDISHLAIPMRRSSGPEKIDDSGSLPSLYKKKTGSQKASDNHFSKRSESARYQSDASSSSDDIPPDPGKNKRGQSLERTNIIEKSPKKREKRDRSAKQKRNLSLDNTLSNSLRRTLEKSEPTVLKTSSIERQKSKSKSIQRQNASESWSSCLAATSDSSKTTENEENYAADRKESTKMQIGKRFLKGEIGIKSFNYYLLKEGLKSSKKFVDKQRNSLTKNDSKKAHSRSEENIYEEIFFVDKNSDAENHGKYPDCELCMQQCTKENCEYCLEDIKSRQYFGSLGRSNIPHHSNQKPLVDDMPTATTAHILQYQSYNPNNPGVYKIETTPVAFTSDYNPIHQIQQPEKPPPQQRGFSRTASSQIIGNRINTKSSSSSDSLHHHKYARDHQSSQELYECNHPLMYGGGAPHMLSGGGSSSGGGGSGPYDQKIYKSDSKVSIISEYSIRSESSNRNFRCGEVSDSSLGDSMFSYSTQRRYFGSSESCRFAFECRRCSLDGEKCSFSDTCRYGECRNCDCSSSYFSSDFDDYSRKNSTGMSTGSQRSYEYYNDTIDVKQNKYAQDFIKHVNDVKRSIYQAELQRSTTDSFGTIPPPKQVDMKKSINHYQPTSTRQQYQQQHRPSRSGSSPFRIAPSPMAPAPPPLCNSSTMMMKDVSSTANRDNKNSGSTNITKATIVDHTMDNENSMKALSSLVGGSGGGINDKIMKYSDGKYAQTTTSHQPSDMGKQNIKDSLERSSQRKQTGAIPKLSSSSASSLHQSLRNQRNNNNNKENNIQKIAAITGNRSPRSSPKQQMNKDSTKIPIRPNNKAASLDHYSTPELKKLIPPPSIQSTKVEGANQRTNSKDRRMRKNNQSDQSNEKSTKMDERKDNTFISTQSGNDPDSNVNISQSKDNSHREPSSSSPLKVKDEKRNQKKAKFAEKSAVSNKENFLKPCTTTWSDLEEGDDDVFIDAPKTINDTADENVAKRQRCFALPGSRYEEQTEKNRKNEPEEKTTPSKSARGAIPPGQVKQQPKGGATQGDSTGTTISSLPEISRYSKAANTKRTQIQTTRNGEIHNMPSAANLTTIVAATIGSSASLDDDNKTTNAAVVATTTTTTTPQLTTNEVTQKQHSKKSTITSHLSMKEKQQIVESVSKQSLQHLPTNDEKGDPSEDKKENDESSHLIPIDIVSSESKKLITPVGSAGTSDVPVAAAAAADVNNSTTIIITTQESPVGGADGENEVQVSSTALTSVTTASSSSAAADDDTTSVDGAAAGGTGETGGITDTAVVAASISAGGAGAGATCAEREISRESDVAVAGATFNRDLSDKHLVEKEHKEEAIYLDKDQSPLIKEEQKPLKKLTGKSASSDSTFIQKIDFSDLPLPELPPKKRRNRERTSSKLSDTPSTVKTENGILRDFTRYHHQTSSLPKRRESLDSSLKFAADLRKMHYHNLGHMTAAATATSTNPNSMKPTYYFGENRLQGTRKNLSTDEIYLNKSGWVQVSSKRFNNEKSSSGVHHSRKSNSVRLENQNGSLKNSIRVIQIDNTSSNRDQPIYAVPKLTNSKIEELISRSEARRNSNTTKTYMKPGYEIIDPQIASILNERPGFLPVKTFIGNESPPPITPILSPPPAFQDSKTKYKTAQGGNVQIITNAIKQDPKSSKGMVFSRSFEYDNRKPADYAETFSKSFDSNLSEQKPTAIQQREKSPNFSSLTGCSPNYLTKRESSSGRSRESSPKYQQVGSVYLNISNEKPVYSIPKKLDKTGRSSLDRTDRSRRAQFSRVNPTTRFRSFDTTVNQRLNSCDSGARSDLSNDELDNEDDNSTEFLSTSYQPPGYTQQSKPRSLTPDKYDSLGSQKSLRKQRSVTPESRSLTPEDRRKKGSQASLSSRQTSSSRNNTLERKPKYEDKSRSPSRSSSSSSYSGGGLEQEQQLSTPHRRSAIRNSKTPEEHRIRRSRSLQLTERSPSRQIQSHKMVVCLGGGGGGGGSSGVGNKPSNQQTFHHQTIRSFPPTIRPDQIVTDQITGNRNVRSDIDKSRSFDLDFVKCTNNSGGVNNSNQTVPARLDFDKSRSFDEDYRDHSNNLRYLTDTSIIRDDRNSLKPNLQRTSSVIPRQTSPQNYGTRLCDHELTYDMLRRTLDRSPIMDFSRDYDIPKSVKGGGRDMINLSGNELNFLNERIYDHGMKKLRNTNATNETIFSIDRLQKSRDNLTPENEMKTMRDILVEERLRSKGATDYIYRQQPIKTQPQHQLHQHSQLQQKQQQQQQQQQQPPPSQHHQQRSMIDRSYQSLQSLAGSATPSRGSCTASSCDFWPHCGVTNLKASKQNTQSVDRPSINFNAASVSDPVILRAASDEDDEGYVIVQDLIDDHKEKTYSSSVANLPKFSPGYYRIGSSTSSSRPKYNRKSYSLIEVPRNNKGYDIVTRIRSKPPIYVNTIGTTTKTKQPMSSSSAPLFLGEREMPITRERDLQNSPTATSGSGTLLGNSKLSDKQIRQMQGSSLAGSGDFRLTRSTELRRKVGGTPSKTRLYCKKQRSLSLPNVFLQTQFPSSSLKNDNVRHEPFSSNLSNQIRAVSSPSLSENPSEIIQQTENSGNSPSGCGGGGGDCEGLQGHRTEGSIIDEQYITGQNYAGVLQKFKKTFSQFKNTGKQITPQTTASEIESGKYRFGPLIWRSSKERRKAKYNRRDKCNSGDSGIQIELENDEIYIQDPPESVETSPSLATSCSVRVRRTNSAKISNSMTSSLSAKAKALKKVESYENKLVASTPLPTRSLSQPSGLDRMARTDLDESDTDSVSSHPDLHEGHRYTFAEVLYPFTPAGPQELALEKGNLIEVLRKDIGPWWYGRIKHDAIIENVLEPQQGWFPKEFVRIILPYFDHRDDTKDDDHHRHCSPPPPQVPPNENNTPFVETCDNRMNNTTTILPCSKVDGSSATTTTGGSAKIGALLSPSQICSQQQQQQQQHIESFRNNVIKELLETEINYVKLLSSLCLGYLREMRKRVDIFPPDSLNLIFSNIESIWRFQQTFLDALRKGVENRRIGQVFLDHQAGFLVYSNYCNSYPRALMELESYSSSKDAKCVLENCRLAENLPELPLSAHLLAPIQRICRYPLHLAELVKHTPSRQMIIASLDENCSSHDIGDCKETLEIALAAMKKVTETVNEGKRHSEHLTRFQASFENFQGPPIAFHSTRFFMQTDATRVSPNLWNNTYTLFLFDHQLIYCKKDILKRNHYIYKGRIFLDNCRILNLPDGKLFGMTLKNALRIYCESRNKWFDFCFRSASRKLRFLSTLAVERQFCGSNLFVSELVGDDDDNLSDREYHSDYDTPTGTMDRGMSAENFKNMMIYDTDQVAIAQQQQQLPESPGKLQKYSDTLPKKSKKPIKDGYEYNTGSLGRRRIGNWFRKAKSTNSTPTQSPTHQSTALAFNSDSSSQSSPALGYKPNKSKIKDQIS